MVEAPQPHADATVDGIAQRRSANAVPMRVPDYVANPDVLDGHSNERLGRLYQTRSQQHYGKTLGLGASSESLESMAVHIDQIERELLSRGLTPTFTPVDLGMSRSTSSNGQSNS